MKIILISIVLLAVCAIRIAFADQPPAVTKIANGKYSIQFTESQQKAVAAFLKQHQ